MRLLVSLALVALLAAACESTTSPAPGDQPTATPTEKVSEPTAEPTPEATPTAVAEPVTITGSGISKSKPFALAGDYEVTWTAQADSSGGCYHGASLQRADGEFTFETLVNELISDAKPHSGTTNLYNLDATQYYVDASSGCSWSFTFTPQ